MGGIPYCLGRLPHDPAAVAQVPAHVMAADAPVPPRLDRSHIPFTPELGGNGQFPDCTAVATFNCASAFGWVRSKAAPAIVPAKILPFYGLCIGDPPDLAATDGAVMLDVLNRGQSDGIDFGLQVPLGLTMHTIDASNRAQIAHVTLTHGAADLGVRLTALDMQKAQNGDIWDDDGGDNSPEIGGHDLFSWQYAGLGDADLVSLGTWGFWQRATWRWLARRTVEAYAVTFPQLVGPG